MPAGKDVSLVFESDSRPFFGSILKDFLHRFQFFKVQWAEVAINSLEDENSKFEIQTMKGKTYSRWYFRVSVSSLRKVWSFSHSTKNFAGSLEHEQSWTTPRVQQKTWRVQGALMSGRGPNGMAVKNMRNKQNTWVNSEDCRPLNLWILLLNYSLGWGPVRPLELNPLSLSLYLFSIHKYHSWI